VCIPYDQLSPDTLRAVIEEFVTRDGTDYGEIEVSLEQKVSQVSRELKSGKALILFDTGDQTCNIFAKDDPAIKDLLGKTIQERDNINGIKVKTQNQTGNKRNHDPRYR